MHVDIAVKMADGSKRSGTFGGLNHKGPLPRIGETVNFTDPGAHSYYATVTDVIWDHAYGSHVTIIATEKSA